MLTIRTGNNRIGHERKMERGCSFMSASVAFSVKNIRKIEDIFLSVQGKFVFSFFALTLYAITLPLNLALLPARTHLVILIFCVYEIRTVLEMLFLGEKNSYVDKILVETVVHKIGRLERQ